MPKLRDGGRTLARRPPRMGVMRGRPRLRFRVAVAFAYDDFGEAAAWLRS